MGKRMGVHCEESEKNGIVCKQPEFLCMFFSKWYMAHKGINTLPCIISTGLTVGS